jgi:prepilin-type N-terminal cleavage/methylation domain-containing protein
MYMKKQQGFTLVEMLISLAVGVVVLAAIYALVNLGQKNTVNVERKVYAFQDARSALEVMSMEIQMASYNPSGNNIWKNPADCTSISSNPAYRGIQQATASKITIETDINESLIIGDINNEVITYEYDSTNQRITRSMNCGTAAPFLGNLPGSPRAVHVINTNAVPVFRYFDAQGNEITSTSLPAGIPNIARIDITLWVETAEVDVNVGRRKQITYATSIIPRNHVISR